MKEVMITTRKEVKVLLAATLSLLVVFAISLVQNIIRYGIHESYNPWKSVLYLGISLLLFLPFLPGVLHWSRILASHRPTYFWVGTTGLVMLSIGLFYVLSSILIHLAGFYDGLFATRYARQYFGREALYHLLVLTGIVVYVRLTSDEEEASPTKVVSGIKGQREVTIKADQVYWVETDDHYLRLHCETGLLLKRYTMEKMAKDLDPEFLRIHRKYLVNRRCIVGIEKEQRKEYVLLQDGQKLRVGKAYQPVVW